MRPTLFLLVALLGCDPTPQPTGDGAPDVTADRGQFCVPGSIAACTGPNGDISELPCNGGGGYYDSCRCGGPDVPQPVDRPLEAAVDGDSDGGDDAGTDAGGDVASDAAVDAGNACAAANGICVGTAAACTGGGGSVAAAGAGGCRFSDGDGTCCVPPAAQSTGDSCAAHGGVCAPIAGCNFVGGAFAPGSCSGVGIVCCVPRLVCGQETQVCCAPGGAATFRPSCDRGTFRCTIDGTTLMPRDRCP